MNTQKPAVKHPEETIRVPTVTEHLLRAIGFKRHESLYGVEGDQLAARYPQKKFQWALGYDEPIPLFLEQSRQNQMKAYCLLAIIAITGLFLFTSFVRSGSRDTGPHYDPSAELSPAEKLLMNTAQQQLGVSDKAMQEFYHPTVQPEAPPPAEQPPAAEQSGAPPQQHRPPSMRTFGLRAQREQMQMQQQQQQQYGSPMQQQPYGAPVQQQPYGAPVQQGQPQRMQVYVAR